MSKLRFDPTTYQFYFSSGREEGSQAKAAGFRWDPFRNRYYTGDPTVAKSVADCGDHYVKHLLADILGVTIVTDPRAESGPATARH